MFCGDRAGRNFVSFLILVSFLALAFSLCRAQETKNAFKVADDIELSVFGGSTTGGEEPIQFSPDGNYFVVWTERGLLDLNRVEDSVRCYRSGDSQKFL